MFKQLLFLLSGLLISFHAQAQTITPTSPNDPQAVSGPPVLGIRNPIAGAVYQHTNGQAKLTINGRIGKSSSSQYGNMGWVQAKLQKLDLQNGNALPVSPIYITLNQDGSSFNTDLMVDKGWYELIVSSSYLDRYNNSFVSVEHKRKVGVGEVFVIAGQSNAQGGFGVANGTVLMDAVRVTSDIIPREELNVPATAPNKYLRIATMRSVAESGFIGPLGPDLWYWASVGAQLANDPAIQAPVAFFNAALGGTTVTNWVTSTNRSAKSSAQGSERYSPGAPYHFFGDLLDMVRAAYGVRAVLWMQGETDTKAIVESALGDNDQKNSWLPQNLINANNDQITAPFGDAEGKEIRAIRPLSSDYAEKLKGVIQASRIKGAASWMVSRTSFITVSASDGRKGRTATEVTNSQLVSSLNALNVFDVCQGPETDGLIGNAYRRPDTQAGDEPVHFNTSGAATVATLWANRLKTCIIDGSLPPTTVQSLGTEPRLLTVASNGTVSAPDGFSEYRWVPEGNLLNADASVASTRDVIQGNVSTPQVVNGKTVLPAGEYRAFIRNAQGNFILTNSVELPTPTSDPGGNPQPPSGSQCKNGNEATNGNRTPNGATVGGFGNPSEFMEYTFNATAGSTTFSIHYASGDAQAGISLVVNGTTIPMYRPSTGSWTPNADATMTINLIGGTNTIRIQGSETGNFSYDRICIGSSTTGGGGGGSTGCAFSINPSVSNSNLGCNAALTLFANCSGNDCGSVNFSWSGNGQTYSGTSPGITGPGNNGSFVYTLTASKAGCTNQTGNTSVNVSGCGGTPPGLSISGASLNCSTGEVSLQMNGLNGNPVEYQAPGLQGWSTNPLVVPTWQRNGTSFTFYARQAGNNEASIGYTTSCPGYRIAIGSAEEAAEGLWVSPNPTSGKVVARFTLGTGERATLSVVSMAGQSLQTRAVVGTGKVQEETLDLSQQTGGLYVVRLQTAAGAKTAKVMLQR